MQNLIYASYPIVLVLGLGLGTLVLATQLLVPA